MFIGEIILQRRKELGGDWVDCKRIDYQAIKL